MKSCPPRAFLLALLLPGVQACTNKAEVSELPSFAVSFDGQRGQLQVGGNFAGVEFHHSRPFPSRISFYAPVANSIDLSTDYWARDESQPFAVALDINGNQGLLQNQSFAYRATPAQAIFSDRTAERSVTVSYRFGEALPIMVLRIKVRNESSVSQSATLSIDMAASLHTSHAYTLKDTAFVSYAADGRLFQADFDEPAAGHAQVFVLNVGNQPDRWGSRDSTASPASSQLEAQHEKMPQPEARFDYNEQLGPGEELDVIQVIGSCLQRDCEALIPGLVDGWQQDVANYERRVSDYALDETRFVVDDSNLVQTMRWSKALLQADQHYIDGHVVPMPTPAQYNFFFAHDLMLTDLGAVFFDVDRVKSDLSYLRILARGDSLLPHAYYWREDRYVTEPANPDNWNHLWLVILSSSYLKHSGDANTIQELLPMIRQSLRIMLRNERDGLMYASRPDWWDIGNVFGPRAYITTLTIRALESYLYLVSALNLVEPAQTEYAELADTMRRRLVENLWNDDAGYLLNGIDESSIDHHYYSGSLIAAGFDVLDDDHKRVLIETARKELLDQNVGIRNAMPPDFHNLTETYRFNGPEVGAPYKYMNGGVWPQGVAWYVLALIAADRPDEAADATRAYLSLDGIRNSPNGQPAFYEYRDADSTSTNYGQIDKTTFLWAGGWYLHVLYQLAGLRENSWNLSFDARTPAGFESTEYDLQVSGVLAHVRWTGEGTTFRQILIDGQETPSAVLVDRASTIVLERGKPVHPYLAEAEARVLSVAYDEAARTLTVSLAGITGAASRLQVVATDPARRVQADGLLEAVTETESDPTDGVYRITVSGILERQAIDVIFSFGD